MSLYGLNDIGSLGAFSDDFKIAGTSNEIIEAARAVGLALAGGDRFPTIGDWRKVQIRRQRFWHRLPLTAVTANQEIKFFNVAQTANICNLPSQGSVGSGSLAFLTSLRFKIEQGYKISDNTAVTAAESAAASATNNGNPVLVAADIKQLLDHGLVNLKAGSRDLVKDTYGLYNFPSGGGMTFGGTSATSGTTANLATYGAFTNNGEANSNNGFAFLPIPWVTGDDTIDLTVRYPFARALTAELGIRAEIDTIYLTLQK